MTNDKEIVVIHDSKVVTTSLQVAEVFNKRHDHVMRDIDSLEKDVPNFGEMFYEAETPDSYGRPRRTFFINRDGFTLLAMGFNGKKALGFKLNYIEQFNTMENQLKSQVALHSYMIADPIKRAEQWILEQQEKMLLEEKVQEQTETITHKIEIIEGLTDNISLDQKRKLLNKVVRHGCYYGGQIADRWKHLYEKFQQEYSINAPLRAKNYNEKNNKKYGIVDYVENILGMFEELFAVAMKVFATDAKKIIAKEKALLMQED